MPTTEPDGGPGRTGQFGPEAGYVAARLAEDYVECVRELLGMRVWLPVKGPQESYIVTYRGARAWCARHLAGAGVGGGRAGRRSGAGGTAPVRAAGRHLAARRDRAGHQPGQRSELQIPRRLFERVLKMLSDSTGGGLGGGPPAGTGGPPRPTPIDPPNRIGGFRFAAVLAAGRALDERHRIAGELYRRWRAGTDQG